MRLYLKLNSIWLAFLLVFVASTVVQAQWNWPEDKKTAEEKVVLYTDFKKQGNFEAAEKPLQWLLENAPDLNPSIYINGAEIYEELAEKETDPAKKKEYINKALEMYDARIKYFGGDADILNRKANAAFKLFFRDRSEYDRLKDIFSKALEANGENFAYYNIVPYISVVKTLYEQGQMNQDQVIEIYDKLNAIIDKNVESGSKNADKYREQAEKLDGIFMATINVDCEFIANKMVPKMEQNPDDTELAKKIIALSLAAQCTDRDFFTKAAITTFEKEPNAGLAKTIGERMMRNENYEEAVDFLNQAAELSENDEQKADIYLSLASLNQKQGNKSAARDYALRAAQASRGVADKAYTLVGNMYFTSYEQCKQGKDVVEDRAVFIAAYEMYKRAGNTEGMQNAKEQFPSKEEVFTYNKRVGDQVKVGCWINETVTIQTRD